MKLKTPVRWVVGGLAIRLFVLLEVLGLPRVPREKNGKDIKRG